MQLVLKGKFKWCRAVVPQEPLSSKPGEKPRAPSWSVAFYPEPDALEQIRDLQGRGLKNVLKKDDDNLYNVNFNRPIWRDIKGKRIDLAPPKISGVADPNSVGNGSEGEIILDVYPHSTPTGAKAHAARWEGLNITKLVERPLMVS